MAKVPAVDGAAPWTSRPAALGSTGGRQLLEGFHVVTAAAQRLQVEELVRAPGPEGPDVIDLEGEIQQLSAPGAPPALVCGDSAPLPLGPLAPRHFLGVRAWLRITCFFFSLSENFGPRSSLTGIDHCPGLDGMFAGV